eukprot:3027431-Prymnesium_polylepis.1
MGSPAPAYHGRADSTRAPPQLNLERGYLTNRHRLKLRRFTIRADRPKAACILTHGYGQSAHFEFLCATYPGGPHSTWDDSILQHLADAGISCYAIDLQGHGESEGARGLRGFFEAFDDLAIDLLQLHDVVREETGGTLPICEWRARSLRSFTGRRIRHPRPQIGSDAPWAVPWLAAPHRSSRIAVCGGRSQTLHAMSEALGAIHHRDTSLSAGTQPHRLPGALLLAWRWLASPRAPRRVALHCDRTGVSGMVMLAPMISLDKVTQKSVLGPIKNKHLVPIGGLLSFLVPTLPLIAKSESVLAQQIDREVRTRG